VTNLIENGSFENGWRDVLVPGTSTINQEPTGWVLTWLNPGDPLRSADWAGPDDEPHYLTARTVPECVHKLNSQLPPDQQFGGSDALVLEGNCVYKVFSSVRPFGVRLLHVVGGLNAGCRVVLEVPVRVHHHGDGSPGAAVWRIGIDDADGPWLTFKEDFNDREYLTFGMDAVVDDDGAVLVCIDLESRSLAGIDFFIDDVRLRYLDDAPLPIPEPEPCEGWTIGREQYERTYVLMPPGCDDQWPMAAMAATWNDERFTVGGSADDAGIGPEVRRVLAINDMLWHDDGLGWWFDEHYPGLEYVPLYADSPADLEDVLTDYIHGGVVPVPDPPEPGPEPEPEKPQYALRSDNLIGLHSGFTKAQSFPYIEQSGTTVQKFFSAGDAYEAARRAPGIISIWRKFVGNEQGRIWEHPTIRESALWYLDQYTAEIETARANMGLTLEQFLARPLALESLNETVPTHNLPVLHDCVEFDVHFSDLAHARYGGAINTVLLCGAIGNPHETEVPYLLPAAKQAALWEDFLGYHCYWTATPDASFLTDHWRYHAGRWIAWDEYFVSQGVYVRYASGEGGIVYSPSADGTSFDAGQGWRATGSFESYLHDIGVFNALCLEWNRTHGNRFAGLTLFCYGQWGWDSFELGDGEVILLSEWSQTL